MPKKYERHGEGGKNPSPEYRAWESMRARCKNTPKNSEYRNYGGRGIKVCERWDNSFLAFLDDMGRKPTPQHSLDRVNNDGDYCPTNCRWATNQQQSINRRTIRLLEDRINELGARLAKYEVL